MPKSLRTRIRDNHLVMTQRLLTTSQAHIVPDIVGVVVDPRIWWTDIKKGEENITVFPIAVNQHETVKLFCPTNLDRPYIVWLKDGEEHWDRSHAQVCTVLTSLFLSLSLCFSNC